MNVHFPAPRRKWPARLLNLAVVIVVLALVAATFVLSYPGLHTIVSQAGESARLARIYPGLFDALFVIACVAAVVLREARWWARCYAWLVIILVVAVVGAADAVHAMNVALPHRQIEGVVAAAPWVLVLLGFSLMLTMLRQPRVRPVTAPAVDPVHAAPAARELSRLPAAAPPLEVPALPPATTVAETAPVSAVTATPEPVALPSTVWADEPAPEPEPEPETEAAAVPDDELAPQAEVERPAETGQEFAEEEPVSASALDGEPAGEREPAEPASEPASAAAAWESATAYADSGLGGGQGYPVSSGFPFWETDEEGRPDGQGHPPTVPSPVVDDDAPPFATAPFATVPRLNRVRSTPTPPGDDEDEE